MAMTLKSARQWNRALLSIYYFGRKGTEPFARMPVPRRVWPLEKAVATLTESQDREALSCVRLALADLCRTRTLLSPADPVDKTVEEQIVRLTIAFSQLVGIPNDAREELARIFSGLSRGSDSTVDPYVRALNLMAARDPRFPGRKYPVLVSYKVTRHG